MCYSLDSCWLLVRENCSSPWEFVVEEVAKSEFRFDLYLPLVTRAFSCLLLPRMPGSCFGLSACAIICVTPADH